MNMLAHLKLLAVARQNIKLANFFLYVLMLSGFRSSWRHMVRHNYLAENTGLCHGY